MCGSLQADFSSIFLSDARRTIPFGRETLQGVAKRTFVPYVKFFPWCEDRGVRNPRLPFESGKKFRIFFAAHAQVREITNGMNVRLAAPWTVSLPKGMVLRPSDPNLLLKWERKKKGFFSHTLALHFLLFFLTHTWKNCTSLAFPSLFSRVSKRKLQEKEKKEEKRRG